MTLSGHCVTQIHVVGRHMLIYAKEKGEKGGEKLDTHEMCLDRVEQ